MHRCQCKHLSLQDAFHNQNLSPHSMLESKQLFSRQYGMPKLLPSLKIDEMHDSMDNCEFPGSKAQQSLAQLKKRLNGQMTGLFS